MSANVEPEDYRLIDLFCGAGGMTLGFVDSRFCGGFRSVLGLDNDKASIATHKRNFKKSKGKSVVADIEQWLKKTNAVPKADIVIGGPPCQGFSLLNKKREGDKRRELWEPFLEVVQRSGASVFVMENVAELYRSHELSLIQAKAEKLGFSTKSAVLNAADYGAPQIRRRTFVIGWKKELQAPEFPPAKTHSADENTGLLPWKTVKDAIDKLPAPKGTDLRKGKYRLHFGRNPTEVSLARYKVVPPGGNRFDLQRLAPELTPQCWINKKSGGTDLFGRLWWNRPSVTIRTEFFKPEKGRYLHPTEHRPITHFEAARLMGFVDDFHFVGSKTEIARQIGNAVPPPLAEAVARVALSILIGRDGKRISLGEQESGKTAKAA